MLLIVALNEKPLTPGCVVATTIGTQPNHFYFGRQQISVYFKRRQASFYFLVAAGFCCHSSHTIGTRMSLVISTSTLQPGIDMWMDMCIDMCMCIDMRVDMCIDMCRS